MDNVYFHKEASKKIGEEHTDLQLLFKRQNLEIMLQEVKENSFVWITPSETEDAVEFFYILEGVLTVEDENEKNELSAGDCFCCDGLKKEIILRSEKGFKMLYFSTVQTFDYLDKFNSYLSEILKEIEQKDKYTYGHCNRVMEYSIKIATAMKLKGVSVNNITVAAAFHDVGKCFVPDEILQKTGKLTQDDFLEIMKHPVSSAKMLQKRFGKKVTSIVEAHHERLDGSGYPFGKTKDQIPIEAQIIAIADSFDAMTTQRTYNNPKPFDEAIEELYSMTDKYNQKIVLVLKELYEKNEIKKI